MTLSEISFWQLVASDLKIAVMAPYTALLNDGSLLEVSGWLKNFGPPMGMLVDDNYSLFASRAREIRSTGYGYSANLGAGAYDRSSMIEVLRDWGWSGPEKHRPDWLEPNRKDDM